MKTGRDEEFRTMVRLVRSVRRVTMSEIMTRNVITLQHDDLLATAARTIVENGIHGIIVLEGTKPWSVITGWDLLHKSYLESFSDKMDYLKTPLHDIIETPELYSLSPDATLEEAAELISEKNTRTIPIIKDGKLKGVVSILDIIKTYHRLTHYRQ